MRCCLTIIDWQILRVLYATFIPSIEKNDLEVAEENPGTHDPQATMLITRVPWPCCFIKNTAHLVEMKVESLKIELI